MMIRKNMCENEIKREDSNNYVIELKEKYSEMWN